MIKVYSGSITLKGESGLKELYNLDELKDALISCCHRVNMDDLELADDIVAVVREFSENQTHLTKEKLHQIIVKILNDAGLRPLAEEYHETFLENNDKDDLITPDLDCLVAELQKDPFFIACDLKKISQETIKKASILGFEKTSPDFLFELAKTIWINADKDNTEDDNDYWLFRKEELFEQLPTDIREHFLNKIISVRSISRLFPSIYININILKFAQLHSGPILAELDFLPKFESICQAVKSIDNQLRQLVFQRMDLLIEKKIKTQLQISGMKELSLEYFDNETILPSLMDQISQSLNKSLSDKNITIDFK